jgi:membrane-bound lytic murein transglycosylase F
MSAVRPPFRTAGVLTAALLVGTCSQPPTVLEQVLGSGVLKVATRNSPTAYYLGVEGPEGPEYELARGFARQLGVEVSFIVAPSAAAAVDAVVRNQAHVAAAGIVTSELLGKRVAFGPTYQTLSKHVIYRSQEPAPPRATGWPWRRRSGGCQPSSARRWCCTSCRASRFEKWRR